MGAGPIPYSAIRTYADEYGIVGHDEFSFFAGIINGLDGVYLEVSNKSTKEKEEAEMIPISDVQSTHQMFAKLRARAAADPKLKRKK